MKPVSIFRIVLVTVSIAVAFRVDAREVGLVFFLQTVDRGGYSPGIDIDRDGMPHIGYVDLARHKVRYAHRTETGWSTEDVSDWGGDGLQGCSFRLSAAGTPFFAFKRLGYYGASAMREGSGWRIEDISSCNGGIRALALSAAPDGSMHACFSYTCSGGIYYDGVDYAIWRGNGWVASSVGWAPNAFAFHGISSIAATSAADPHISLWADYSGVGYFRKVGDSWVREIVGRGSWNSIALNAAGVPYVAFYDSVAGALWLGVRGPQGWTVEVVDDDGDVGKNCTLAIGVDGSLHIAYYDATRGDLKYATRVPGATGWAIQVVASNGDVGRYLSLALDAKGDVHIAFYDSTDGALKYATTSRRVSVQPTSWGRAKARYR